MGRKKMWAAMALAAMFVFASGVWAQQQATPPASPPAAAAPTVAPAAPAPAPMAKMEKFSGVIVKVDEGTKDVLVQFHKEKMTFAFDDQTKITEGHKTLAFGDLKKGMWAAVEYKKEGDKLSAGAAHVSMPKAAEKAEKTTAAATEMKAAAPAAPAPAATAPAAAPASGQAPATSEKKG